MSSNAGELVTETLEYDGGRPGTAYVPPEPPRAVVFAGDGQPRAYLVAGTAEPFFRANAARWAAALRAAQADVVLAERAGAHGGAFWRDELPLMAAWAFTPAPIPRTPVPGRFRGRPAGGGLT